MASTIPFSRLLALLENYRGAVIATMVCRTMPELLKRSRRDKTPTAEVYPHGVEKLAKGRCCLAADYQRNVRTQRAREGHRKPTGFRAEGIWNGQGERVGRFLVRHRETGQFYVRARPQGDEHGRPVRLWERWIDLATGRDVEGDALDRLKTDYLRHLPSEDRKQELIRRVPYRTYHLVGIHSVVLGGEVYQIDGF